MKKSYNIAAAIACALMFAACAEVDKSCDDGSEVFAFRQVEAQMAELVSSLPSARAQSGFVMNTVDDPTFDFAGKFGWSLDLTIMDKDGNPYPGGIGTLTKQGNYWVSPVDMFMPNYLTQKVTAELYPASWDGSTIATDQRVESVFLEQDILVQDGLPTYQTAPAHYLQVRMRHAHSMIDFVLADVNPADITSVTVEAGGSVYHPFKADVSSREEYLVILPVGTSSPTIVVETAAGAVYRKTLSITSSAINNCYYVKLVGLELVLEAINVSNWTYGEAVPGDYSTVTSYPTFRGPAGMNLTMYWDNGVVQDITFNNRGEITVKPGGRTIVRIVDTDSGAEYVFDEPLSIRGMVVDLNDYIDMIS